MKKPNILLIGVDSLRRDKMSMYGYKNLTTPHLSKWMADGVIFNNCFSPSVPTPPGYSSMLTGKDCFGTEVVALRHHGEMGATAKTLAQVLSELDYDSVCIGFDKDHSNAYNKGFKKYLGYDGWGSSEDGKSHKAEAVNDVAVPELERMIASDKPFFMMLRHLDPHSPYLPPAPYDKAFYNKDYTEKEVNDLQPVWNFKPFCDYFASWIPNDCRDSDYVDAQYDGAIAYMDACLTNLFKLLEDKGVLDNTIVILTSDHGETLYEHECYYDHHSLYDHNLIIPLAIRWPECIPANLRIDDYVQLKDIMPTILKMMEIETDIKFDGRDLTPLLEDGTVEQEPEFYITEATWMRKHGWRTPEYKYIRALEPDFHYFPEVELYNIIKDPQELHNIAKEEPEMVKLLDDRMNAHIKKREKEMGITNPMYTNTNWNEFGRPFESSDEAYNTMHIGDVGAAKNLQAKE